MWIINALSCWTRFYFAETVWTLSTESQLSSLKDPEEQERQEKHRRLAVQSTLHSSACETIFVTDKQKKQRKN